MAKSSTTNRRSYWNQKSVPPARLGPLPSLAITPLPKEVSFGHTVAKGPDQLTSRLRSQRIHDFHPELLVE